MDTRRPSPAPLRDKAMGLGAKGFLAKPFNKDQLMEAIKSFVGG